MNDPWLVYPFKVCRTKATARPWLVYDAASGRDIAHFASYIAAETRAKSLNGVAA